MGGIFINYRRGPCTGVVQEVRERLARHFGDDQVFLDTSSLVPGRRYPDEVRRRVADCEVLLVVVHPGWADVRDETGRRRLDLEGDWVRLEIELALGVGKTVIPLLVDGAGPPRREELPEGMGELASRQAQYLPGRRRYEALEELVGVLEAHVARTWQPVGADGRRRWRPGRWLGGVTAAAAVLLMGAVPLLLGGEGAGRAQEEPPFAFFALGWSQLLMCAPLVAVAVLWGVLRRSVHSWERELHAVTHERYAGLTFQAAAALVLAAVFAVLSTADHGPGTSLIFLGLVLVGVFRAAVYSLRARRGDEDQWARWPQALPDPASPLVLRRAVVRLEKRMREWSRPLPREQREKAEWVLQDIGEALRRLRRETRRPRLEWLRQDRPWLFSLYVLWVALNTALATAAMLTLFTAGLGSWRACLLPPTAALLAVAVALGTVDVGYRLQYWQRRALLAELARGRSRLAARVAELSSPARTRPTEPAHRTEPRREPA
ncbi:hypothetical protein GCM10027072_28870 [Streptomyces bullii]